MKYIDILSLKERSESIRNDFQTKQPFHYAMFENFFKQDVANLIHENYPDIKDGKWDGTTYVDQKNKFQKHSFDKGSIFYDVFNEMNSAEFLDWLEKFTGIDQLQGDEELFGGGLHQSIAGAFLNVHVDYNIHPKTKFHRRLNVIVYMNKQWHDDYEGHLELWNLSDKKKELLAKYSPEFNRCVIFETNEISFHGHPKPLRTPEGMNRKSIATYYYTVDRPDTEIAHAHNTIYVNTEGTTGQVKRMVSAVKAIWERIVKPK